MKKNIDKIIAVLGVTALIMALGGCSSQTTHTSEVHFSKTFDGETEEYTVGTEGSVALSPDKDDADDDDDDISDELYDATGYIDEDVSYIWDEEGCKHRIFMKPDRITVHVSYEGLTSPDQLNEKQFREDVIPGWVEAMGNWRKEFDKRGLNDVHFTVQYITDDPEDDIVFPTIEDGEVIYNVLDDN